MAAKAKNPDLPVQDDDLDIDDALSAKPGKKKNEKKKKEKKEKKEKPPAKKTDDADKEQKKLEKREKAERKKKEKLEKKAAKKGGIGKIVAVAAALLLVGGVAAVIAFNLFNVRSNYVMPLAQKIPIVNNLLPAQDEAGTADPTDQYANATHEELVAQINELQAKLDQQTQATEELQQKSDGYVDELARLQGVEARQDQFYADKAEFDRMIAENDPNAYVAFYQQTYPDNADQLYREAVQTVAYEKDFKKYIKDIDAVDDAEGARIIEQLVPADMTLVVLIMNNLNSDKCGALLTAMDTVTASSVVKAMAPVQE